MLVMGDTHGKVADGPFGQSDRHLLGCAAFVSMSGHQPSQGLFGLRRAGVEGRSPLLMPCFSIRR
jgi:hypothetical protein